MGQKNAPKATAVNCVSVFNLVNCIRTEKNTSDYLLQISIRGKMGNNMFAEDMFAAILYLTVGRTLRLIRKLRHNNG
jgi:hypothetical protein